MRVLVTRPETDAAHTAALVAALGHEPVVTPLIGVRFLSGPEIDLAGAQALLATSSNGVRSLARRSRDRSLPVFAVGSQTQHTAIGEAFTQVRSADGDSNALAKLVSATLRPADGFLVHATAREAPSTLARNLLEKGFAVRTDILYETPEVSTLPAAAEGGIRDGTIDAVVLYSARTADVFCRRVRDAGLAKHLGNMRVFCISRASADALSGLPFMKVAIADSPNEPSLLSMLGRVG
jgi:uroporphyrinogen-III synthase